MSRAGTPPYQARRAPFGSNLNLPSTAGSTSTSRVPTPLGRGVISLDEWESKSPLTDEQLQSISLVKEKFGQRPLPEKFTKDDQPVAGPSRPSTPIRRLPRGLSSPVGSPSRSPQPDSKFPTSQLSVPVADPLHPTNISTPQQFLDHFTALTLSTEHEQDSLYRDHLMEIISLREKCDGLIELLESGEMEVEEMLKALAYVEERSESLRGACEDLLEEQTHLLTHTSQLAHRLTFFTFLETAQKMLNNPGNNLVLSPDFLPMVKRLDECLGYLGEHRDFKDAELYLIRYQQCMTRSMTLIKLYFVSVVKAMGQEIAKRLGDKGLSETAAQALLYTKFVSLSQSLRPLLAELEARVSSSPDELTPLLSECHAAWITTRQSLMGGRVMGEVSGMDPNGSDLVDLTRSGCGYLKQTCLDEFNLFKHFFLSGESVLYGYLETLCDYLYDHLRPRILHEPSLQVLCGVCTVLQALMVQDISDEDPDEEVLYSPASTPGGISPYAIKDGDDYFSSGPGGRPRLSRQNSSSQSFGYGRGSVMRRQSSFASLSRSMSRQNSTSHHNNRNGNGHAASGRTVQRRKRKVLGRLHIEILLKMVLQDAQTRLVFRAQALLSNDVEYYVPKEGDLNYPEKLDEGTKSADGKLVQRSRSLGFMDDGDDDEPAFLTLPPPEAQESWYPSLRVTLWILSCLYTYVDTAVFEDLAQEAIPVCRKSLSSASDLLSAKKDKSMDGKLFLVRHLLILKEMTAGLGLEAGRYKRRDWSNLGDFLKSLLDNAGTLLGYQRGSIVKAEFAPDARTDVDRNLKIACEDLISLVVLRSTLPLKTFLDRCTAYLARSQKGVSSDLSGQEFAKSEQVKMIHSEFKDLVSVEFGLWKKKLRGYLEDEDTVMVLIPPAQNAIVEAYRQFHDLVRAEYDFSTAAGIMTPSGVMTLLQGIP
ncbi:uncharacterized protein I303_105890 [Kwoniella dejecticola CBS 10117]|uniref:Conserved oligomeric Golgi complex subunit 3 n=1 Tax=Kwoniella dejecticola CBS 10117 TaxID=1296121 RepID=A0A1A6A0N8_9TREE|nr:uncharacterized protein I303_05912 [Kwoniella dejecticola CBS 10117]OBR83632.1 hypothetical protein I303_05912 [Kwoniella dejecticola CBS 10117]